MSNDLTKRCGKCGVVKATSHFYQSRMKKDGLQHQCKECDLKRLRGRAATPGWKAAAKERNARPESLEASREWKRNNRERVREYHRNDHYARNYGLTLGDVEAMASSQEGCCAICLVDLDEKWHLDHNHATGKIRAVLCGACNLGLGKFVDNADFLRNAASYVEFWDLAHRAEESVAGVE